MHLARRREFALLAVALGFAVVLPLAAIAGQPEESHSDQRISQLQAELDRTDLSPELRVSLQEKLAIAEASRQDELEGRAAPADAEGQAAKESALADEARRVAATPRPMPACQPAGNGCLIGQDFSPPVPASVFVPTNAWEHREPGARTLVIAGALGSDERQGAVMVVRFIDDQPPAFLATVSTGGKHGPVTLTGAAGDRLDLEAADGARSRFDVATLAFE